MEFTDEDLKQLKEYVNGGQVDKSAVVEVLVLLPAFIARLEDSEERLSAVAGVIHLIHARYKNDLRQNERAAIESSIALIKEWRKATGK